MDIASRIKKFLDTLRIPNSQFADTCGIPRPSLSQLLNGRNKKVSDEVIGKIHEAYPNLSVLWLMFGEGDMTVNGNIEISEPQKAPELPLMDEETLDEQDVVPSLSSFFDAGRQEQSTQMPERTGQNRRTIEEIPAQRAQTYHPSDHQPSSLSLNVDSSRRVVNIMVFYSDRSFETFVPKGM